MIMAGPHSSTAELLSFLLLLLLLLLPASGQLQQGRGQNSSGQNRPVGSLVRLTEQNRPVRRSGSQTEEKIHQTDVDAEEFPAESMDLTALVNTLTNSSQSGSRQLFSLLSVTSFSALELHKLTLLVYNISGLRSFSSSWFRRRFCYCVSNQTNDLTDFAAILLDVMGNSSTSVHELFKSASILSVSQRNQSSCTYICVMAGRTGAQELWELWELPSITPIFNQTIVEGPGPATRTTNTTQPQPPRPEGPTRDPAPGPGLQPATRGPTFQGATEETRTQPATSQKAPGSGGRTTLPSMLLQKAGCPRRRSDRTVGPGAVVAMTTVGADRLQPCVLELCSFFTRCLCGRVGPQTQLRRFCVKGHVWYQEHTSEVCRRVRRISLSRALKQRCLTKMCKKL